MTHSTSPLAPPVSLRGLTKTFQTGGDSQVIAVDGIDLDISTGEIVALLGPNGAGKTTTLDMVLGFIPPTGGAARVFGLAPRAAVRAGRVGAVLQTGGLLRDLTVRETVEMIASTFPDPQSTAVVLGAAGLSERSDRPVGKCSGGERQRLKFALALLAAPELMILDEPTAGMDVRARHAFWEVMRAEARVGRTVVFATHYLEEAEAFAERIIVLNHGRIVADGPTDQICARTSEREVSARVSDPERACRVLREAGMTAVARAGRVYIRTLDSDTAARLLLNDLDGHDLTVARPSLEAAFRAITDESAGA
ncbi:MAG: ABC transporter ATP-binding protein [Bowdeniella nasicola]|nr:ABC transporter ATP-binding protein [Bowdeniella nasicola]